MSDKIIGKHYSAQRGLFPGLLPDSWYITKASDASVRIELWGRENAQQAVAWLDERETERLAELERRRQAPPALRCQDCGKVLQAPEDTSHCYCWRCCSRRLGD